MKNYSIFTTFAIAALLVSSCAKNEPYGPQAPGFVLKLSALDGVDASVKAEAGDADPYNENLINSFWYFFYPKDEFSAPPAISGFVGGLEERGEYERVIPVSANILSNVLCKESPECQLFVVANPADDMLDFLNGEPDLAHLRSKVVLSSLNEVPQNNFMMVYDNTVEVSRTAASISVHVVLKRLASKFTIGAYVTESITRGGKVYTPVTDEGGLKVSFCNAACKTTLSGFVKSEMKQGDWFDTDPVTLLCDPDRYDLGSEGDPLYCRKYKASAPVYTYPMEWEFASETEPYLLYCLTWLIADGNNPTSEPEKQDLYYKLTLGRRSVMSNEWYDISAKLTVLGSLNPEDPKELFPYMNYQVLGWNYAFSDEVNPNTPAVIKDTRYLAVPQSNWVLNNKNTVTIPYSSSHKCVAVVDSAMRVLYKNGSPEEEKLDSKKYSFDTDVHNQLTFTHELNNSLDAGSNMDVYPYTFVVTLRHEDDENFAQTLRIEQNPAIFVRTEANSMGPGDGGQNSDGNKLGYVYINGAQSKTQGDWRRIAGATSSGNNSSYFFSVVSVSQFDPSTGFVVGDPRNPEIDNLNVSSSSSSWSNHPCVDAPARYKGDGQVGNRQLKYYYPTVDDGSRDNFVAPVFRVSSAYCRSRQDNTYSDIKLRCASYQEDGYPAGRWRLPTLAECKLCQILSDTFVPNIFLTTGKYFYAGGGFTGNDFSYQTTRNSAARCVYDEWYWSQIDDEFGWDNGDLTTTFTWGDLPMNYVH